MRPAVKPQSRPPRPFKLCLPDSRNLAALGPVSHCENPPTSHLRPTEKRLRSRLMPQSISSAYGHDPETGGMFHRPCPAECPSTRVSGANCSFNPPNTPITFRLAGWLAMADWPCRGASKWPSNTNTNGYEFDTRWRCDGLPLAAAAPSGATASKDGWPCRG